MDRHLEAEWWFKQHKAMHAALATKANELKETRLKVTQSAEAGEEFITTLSAPRPVKQYPPVNKHWLRMRQLRKAREADLPVQTL